MRAFAEKFYKSKAWMCTKNAYSKSVYNLCERCLAKGLYNAGEIVHHKIHLNEDNINDANITLSWDNLMLVCRKCHGELHSSEKRYRFDEYGNVIAPL